MRNRHTCTRLGVALLLMGAVSWLPSSTGAQAPQTPPSTTFQVEVNYVDIDTLVTEENGNFVSNLTRDDFEVLEAASRRRSMRSRTWRSRSSARLGLPH